MLALLVPLRVSRAASVPLLASVRKASSNRHTPEGVDEAELKKARDWLRDLTAETIPHTVGELSFSRSSGPGGQNVNKTNSKATLHVALSKLQPHIPAMFMAELRTSRYYKSNSDALVIQADDQRKQGDNARATYQKLQSMIVEMGNKCVPGETSDAQKKRVVALAKASNEKRLREKKAQSSKKAARKGGGGSRFSD